MGAVGFFFSMLAWSCSSSTNVPPETFNPGDASILFHPDSGSDANLVDSTVNVTPDVGAPVDASDAAAAGDGACSPEAGAGARACDGVCVNTLNDPKNCGGCGQQCDSLFATGALCAKGNCECGAPLVNCGQKCTDVTNDVDNCGLCGHGCQGAVCSSGLCAPSPVTNAAAGVIMDLAIDATSVYWTVAGAVYLKQFATPGSSPTVISPLSQVDPRGIAVDTTNVYWVDFASGEVAYTQILAPASTPTVLVQPLLKDAGPSPDQPIDVAVDANNVYWVDQGSGTVNEKPLRGGGAAIVLATGRNHPIAVTFDSKFVYWADHGTTQTGTGSINRVAIGQALGTVTPLATSQDQPEELTVDATSVYWTNRSNSGTVNGVPVGGGIVAVLASNQGGPHGVVVDSSWVYWTNYNDNMVKKAPLTGGSTYTLATLQHNPSAIAVDAKNVYWANQGDGSIWKVAK